MWGTDRAAGADFTAIAVTETDGVIGESATGAGTSENGMDGIDDKDWGLKTGAGTGRETEFGAVGAARVRSCAAAGAAADIRKAKASARLTIPL